MKTTCELTGQHETLIVAETGGPHPLTGSSTTNTTKHNVNKTLESIHCGAELENVNSSHAMQKGQDIAYLDPSPIFPLRRKALHCK